jgi:Na+/H+-dicarboxylate symporter
MIGRHLTLVVAISAVTGWSLAMLFGDVSWLAELMALLKIAFLNALRLIIGPLIFFSLITGILSLGDARRFRTLGMTTLIYYLGTTAVAIAIGLFVVFALDPFADSGAMLAVAPGAVGSEVEIISLDDPSLFGVASSLLRQALVNPISALANLNIIGIVSNALLLGLAGLFVLDRDSPFRHVVTEVTNIIYKLTSWIVMLVPLGVLAITFEMSGQFSGQLLAQLFEFALIVVGATLVHGLIVLPLLARIFGGTRPAPLFRAIARPLLVAFTTSSSSATLPVSMQAAREQLDVEPGIASFVLPLGATMNMDGTALFEGIAAVFLAHLFGIELSTIGTLTVFLMAMIASIGAPGIPSGSMAGMQMVMLAVGIPLEAIGILLLIERPLDTIRTAVNVEGDLVGTLVAKRVAERAAERAAAKSAKRDPVPPRSSSAGAPQ